MRKLMLVAGILLSVIFTTTNAQWYGGINANSTGVNYETALYDTFVGDSTGIGASLGYQATPNVAVELTYDDHGTASGNFVGNLLEYKAKTTALWVVGRHQLHLGGYHFYGNGRVGLASVDATKYINGTDVANGTNVAPAFGIGLQFPVTGTAWSINTGVRLAQGKVKIGGSGTELKEDLTTYTVGIRRDF